MFYLYSLLSSLGCGITVLLMTRQSPYQEFAATVVGLTVLWILAAIDEIVRRHRQ